LRNWLGSRLVLLTTVKIEYLNTSYAIVLGIVETAFEIEKHIL